MKVFIIPDEVVESIRGLVNYCGDLHEAENLIDESNESHVFLEAQRVGYAFGFFDVTPREVVESVINEVGLDEFDDKGEQTLRDADYIPAKTLRAPLYIKLVAIKREELRLKEEWEELFVKPILEGIESGDAMQVMEAASKFLSVNLPEEKTYTVIGFYEDNDQPWLGHGKGKTAKEAVRDAVKDLDSPVNIVEVVEGSVNGVLLKNKITSPEDID